METKENIIGTAVPQFVSPAGDPIRKTYVWNKDKTALIETGEVNIQEEMDEASKGMTPGQQIARIMRGEHIDLPADSEYLDVSDFPESDIDGMNVANAPGNKLEAVAQANGITVDDLQAQLLEIQKQINEKKLAEVQQKEEVK